MTERAAFRHDEPGTPAHVWDGTHGDVLDLAGVDRVVVVAAHPDDEALGAGGLLARATAAGLRATLLVLTDGEGSHPGSPTHPPAALAARRRSESLAAAAALGLEADAVMHAGLPDGGLAGMQDEVVAAIVAVVGDGRATLLAAPYRADGHADHDAAGAAAAIAAHRTDARLVEYPIWLLHVATPATLAGVSVVHLALSEAEQTARRDAIAAHASQVAPLSDAPGDEVLLGDHVLARFRGARERYLVVDERADDDRLDRLHRELEEPWGADERWYEQRKRALLLAMLPGRDLGRVLEVGCSTGVTTAALAGRATEVVAVEASAAALERAAARTAGMPVRLLHGTAPDTWPEGEVDLVVVSEVGYFLSPATLAATIERVAGSLRPGGAVALCHWRHPVRGWPLDAAEVHAAFAAASEAGHGIPPVAATYRDDDVALVLHCRPDAMPDAGR